MASAPFCTVHCLFAAFACQGSVFERTDLQLFVSMSEGLATACFYMYTICISYCVCPKFSVHANVGGMLLQLLRIINEVE